MYEKLSQALSHISDGHIAEAAGVRRSRRGWWLGAAAAVLAVVLLSSALTPPRIQATVISQASESRAMERPDMDSYGEDTDAWRAAVGQWQAQRSARDAATGDALQGLQPFFQATTLAYLGRSTENRVWSPVNGYIALAMLAEVTGGESRAQILAALGEADLPTLRSHVSALWEQSFQDDGHEITRLANSLWLQQGLSYRQQTMDDLAYHHYASVYQEKLSSSQAEKALQTWLNSNTGNLLRDSVAGVRFPEDAVLTLASTVYLQAKWGSEFREANNTTGVFHGPAGERSVTFMNKTGLQSDYYWGDSYGAISLSLKNGTRMWLILPDEDKTVDQVLEEGQFWDMVTLPYSEVENKRYLKVNLSLPKFDIRSSADIAPLVREIGITDVFDAQRSDFSAITGDTPIFVSAVNQAARIIVDEKGVKAASYIEIPSAGAAPPPEEIIDFILDRPFLFVLADTSGIPLFTGVVNAP